MHGSLGCVTDQRIMISSAVLAVVGYPDLPLLWPTCASDLYPALPWELCLFGGFCPFGRDAR